MLRKFEDMNLQMERTGSFKPATAKEALLQMVARNNLLLSDIILKLGISERFDAAWKDADCNKVGTLIISTGRCCLPAVQNCCSAV